MSAQRRKGPSSGMPSMKEMSGTEYSIFRRNQAKEKAQNEGFGAAVDVIVRKRPVKNGETDMVEVDSPLVLVNEDKLKVDLTKFTQQHTFTYDDSFGEGDDTQDLFSRSITDIVANVFDGGTSTAFCFGQTASGKTFTLFGEGGGLGFQDTRRFSSAASPEGDSGGGVGGTDPSRGGLYLLAAHEIFRLCAEAKEGRWGGSASGGGGSDNGDDGGGDDGGGDDDDEDRERAEVEMSVTLSMYEIKGQKLYDLLNRKEELKALEDERGMLQLVGLTQHHCECLQDFVDVSNIGRTARTTASTGANETSSRSHCAMLVRVFRGDQFLGKLSLIDLAGSERGVDNDNTDKLTRKEGRDINTSLLALKEVIRAMQQGSHHAPFRQSKLTQVLEESLTGRKCRTVVVACVSGAESDVQQTINTLRYASDLRPQGSKPSKTTNLLSPTSAASNNPALQRSASLSNVGAAPGGQGRPKAVRAEQRKGDNHNASKKQQKDPKKAQQKQQQQQPSNPSLDSVRAMTQSEPRPHGTGGRPASLSRQRGSLCVTSVDGGAAAAEEGEGAGGLHTNGSGGSSSSLLKAPSFLTSARTSLNRSLSRGRRHTSADDVLGHHGGHGTDGVVRRNSSLDDHQMLLKAHSADFEDHADNLYLPTDTPPPRRAGEGGNGDDAGGGAGAQSSASAGAAEARGEGEQVPPAAPPAQSGRRGRNKKEKPAPKSGKKSGGGGLFSGLRKRGKSLASPPAPSPAKPPAPLPPVPPPPSQPQQAAAAAAAETLGATEAESLSSSTSNGKQSRSDGGGEGVGADEKKEDSPEGKATSQRAGSGELGMRKAVREKVGTGCVGLVLELLGDQGVESDEDMVHLNWEEMAASAKAKGIKTVQMSKLKEWVKGFSNNPDLAPEKSKNSSTASSSSSTGPARPSKKLPTRVQTQAVSWKDGPALPPSSSSPWSWPALSLEAMAEVVGFGWDGLGFELYWRVAEGSGLFDKREWPHASGNPFLTLLIMQRFVLLQGGGKAVPGNGRQQQEEGRMELRLSSDSSVTSLEAAETGKGGGGRNSPGLSSRHQNSKASGSGRKPSSSKDSVEVIRTRLQNSSKDPTKEAGAAAQQRDQDQERKELNSSLPTPSVLALFEDRWSRWQQQDSSSVGVLGGAGLCGEGSASLLGARCFLLLGRDSEACELALLVLGLPDPHEQLQLLQQQRASETSTEISGGDNEGGARDSLGRESLEMCTSALSSPVPSSPDEGESAAFEVVAALKRIPELSTSRHLAARVGCLRVLGAATAKRGDAKGAKVFFTHAIQEAKHGGKTEKGGPTVAAADESAVAMTRGLACLQEVSAVLDLEQFVLEQEEEEVSGEAGAGPTSLAAQEMIDAALANSSGELVTRKDVDALMLHRNKCHEALGADSQDGSSAPRNKSPKPPRRASPRNGSKSPTNRSSSAASRK